MQESAQYLAGEDLPLQVIAALLRKTDIKGTVMLINLSPYDAWLEKVAMDTPKRTDNAFKMPTLSVSKCSTAVSYSERCIALNLLQDPSAFFYNFMKFFDLNESWDLVLA